MLRGGRYLYSTSLSGTLPEAVGGMTGLADLCVPTGTVICVHGLSVGCLPGMDGWSGEGGVGWEVLSECRVAGLCIAAAHCAHAWVFLEDCAGVCLRV